MIVQIMLPLRATGGARQFLGIDSLNMVKLVQVSPAPLFGGNIFLCTGTDGVGALDELAENTRQMDQEDGALLTSLRP